MSIASGTKYLALFYIRAGVRWAQWQDPNSVKEVMPMKNRLSGKTEWLSGKTDKENKKKEEYINHEIKKVVD
jgi:hypothetical protein